MAEEKNKIDKAEKFKIDKMDKRSISGAHKPFEEKTTTIRVKISTKARLDKLKIYRRETYDDLLERVLPKAKS